MPDIVRTIYPIQETLPEQRGIARLARHRDLPQDSRKQPGKDAFRQKDREEAANAATFGELLDNMPLPELDSGLEALARSGEIDFMVTADGQAIELRNSATCDVLLQIPTENVHELKPEGGMLLKSTY